MLDLQRVVVIGAGTMGSGIAQWFAQQMCFVELVDQSSAQLENALKGIHSSWDKLVEKEKFSSCQVNQMKKLLEIKSQGQASANADLVIEAIVENIEIKKVLFSDLDDYFSSSTIIASNTSSFPISLLAKSISEQRRKRFVGLHFFNPATLMKLVEIIPSDQTDPQLSKDLYQWFELKEKKPALSKDSPGFIVNRVARNFYGEPLRIVETDDQHKMHEVDRVLKEVGGFKMGPFELMDLIGIDVNYSVTCSVWEAYNREPRFAPHSLQKLLVEQKRFGKKTKHGYYKYD